jgi:hypothetical protein
MENTHEYAVASASRSLNRAAIELGAEVIALLETAGSQVKITYFWSRARDHAPKQRFLGPRRPLADAVSGTAVTHSAAGSPLAALLRDSISEHSQSFILFPWQGDQNILTCVIGFEELMPPVEQVPEALVENLYLLGWANWSAKEIARLRGELRTVNERLAGRKLVERAKSTLQAEQSIGEEQAYEYLRRLSRKRRITLAALSAEILGGRAGSIVAPAGSSASRA